MTVSGAELRRALAAACASIKLNDRGAELLLPGGMSMQHATLEEAYATLLQCAPPETKVAVGELMQLFQRPGFTLRYRNPGFQVSYDGAVFDAVEGLGLSEILQHLRSTR